MKTELWRGPVVASRCQIKHALVQAKVVLIFKHQQEVIIFIKDVYLSMSDQIDIFHFIIGPFDQLIGYKDLTVDVWKKALNDSVRNFVIITFEES